MFDESLPGPTAVTGVSDAALIAAIGGWARTSAAAEARKLSAIAELVRRRTAGGGEHPEWACDDWDAAAAEVSCALTLGHGRALGQLDLAVTLRDRLPKVGRRFLSGEISAREVSAIAWRTLLVRDQAALAALDDALADRAAKWGPLSQYKLEQAIDKTVAEVDPDAVRRTRNSARGRSFTVGDRDDDTATTAVFGRLSTTDAALLEQRLTAMAKSVCEDDPRTLAQRRADSVGAIAAGSGVLQCHCGDQDCSAAAVDDGRASSVVIHVIAEQRALDEPADGLLDGRGVFPDATDEQCENENDQSRVAASQSAGVIPGRHGGIVPAPLLAELVARGAKVRFLKRPSGQPEGHYRPSAALDEFVRIRDLTCRFPGCDRPAVLADIDHTNPWPAGGTHPGNLKCYCRTHHLVKTFWPDWWDEQRPDGTVRLTTPTGHTYTTKPFSAVLFPAWNTETAPTAAEPQIRSAAPGRQLMMPTRRTSRAKAREYRINAERALNAAENLLRNFERAQPPPF